MSNYSHKRRDRDHVKYNELLVKYSREEASYFKSLSNEKKDQILNIEKDINERMAATVRHNRARGSHSVTGMSNMVFDMLKNGWSDEDICNHLGMEAEEILKLKHITGFSKLFQDSEFKKAWETNKMIKIRKEHENSIG